MKIFITVLIITLISSCNSQEVFTEKDFIGKWQCNEISNDLAEELKIKKSSFKCEIMIMPDGTYAAKQLPYRNPYRLSDDSGSWSLHPGDITPTGKPSLYLGNVHLAIKNKFNRITLVYTISGKDNHKIIFQK